MEILSLYSNMVVLLLFALTILPLIASVSGRDDFYDVTVTELGTTAQLHCYNSTEYPDAPNDSMPISWMLPDLEVLYASKGNYTIKDNNWTLEVNNVSPDHFGLYHCMLRSPEVDWFLVRAGLNAGGPYFEDLWDKYWLNTVIGISAFFGFLLLAIGTILIYRFRWRGFDDEEDNDGHEAYDAYGMRTITVAENGGIGKAVFNSGFVENEYETVLPEVKPDASSSASNRSSTEHSNGYPVKPQVLENHDKESVTSF